MRVHLLYRNRDFDFQAPLPWSAEALTKDLELATLFGAMAQGDEFLSEAVRQVFLTGFETQIGTIRYRQEILQDCLKHPRAVRELYALAGEAMELSKKQYIGFLVHNPDAVLWGAIDHMKTFLGVIRKLRGFADSHAGNFASEGWSAFFSRLKQELDDEYLAEIERHLGVLRFRHQLVLSAELGAGNKGERYLLHRPGFHRRTWLEHLILWLKTFFGWQNSPGAYGFSLHPNDESGARALSELRNRGLSDVAGALARARDNVRDFFIALQKELAFYVGCLNLQKRLDDKGEPLCFPVPEVFAPRRLSFRGLYDVCLSLRMKHRVVGNDAGADDKELVMITGANQGGKSTFLRSVGLAQLMMQCGMFVPAEALASSLCGGLFTHYKREEDSALESGKLDEELGRMSDIVDHLPQNAMILMNESFSATNDREGAEIARQIVSALLDGGIRVLCVTHLYELARGFHENNRGNALFLRAEREEVGNRTFKLIEAGPQPTSFAEDLYRSVFGASAIEEGERERRPPTENGTPLCGNS